LPVGLDPLHQHGHARCLGVRLLGVHEHGIGANIALASAVLGGSVRWMGGRFLGAEG
jgi:hypothetical protein